MCRCESTCVISTPACRIGLDLADELSLDLLHRQAVEKARIRSWRVGRKSPSGHSAGISSGAESGRSSSPPTKVRCTPKSSSGCARANSVAWAVAGIPGMIDSASERPLLEALDGRADGVARAAEVVGVEDESHRLPAGSLGADDEEVRLVTGMNPAPVWIASARCEPHPPRSCLAGELHDPALRGGPRRLVGPGLRSASNSSRSALDAALAGTIRPSHDALALLRVCVGGRSPQASAGPPCRAMGDEI